MFVYRVDAGCCFCQECIYVCPVGAISMDNKGAHVDESKCKGCGICANNCASEAIVKIEIKNK
jgi:Pyruvate/2-oxoacid:ferredoxin oxidoreductase delta subunit